MSSFLQGLSEYPRAEKFLFVILLVMYLVILLVNSTLIILTLLDSHFYIPMYFILSNLSFLDILCTSSFIPSTMTHFLSEEKKNLLHWMYCSDVCLLHHGIHRVCDPSSDGTWLLHSHLHAFEIPYHHEQGTLYSNGSSLMKMGLSQLIDTNNSCSTLALLWGKCHQSFCLWNIGLSQASLHRYFLEWDYSNVWQCTVFVYFITIDFHLLHFHPFYCIKNQFIWRKKKGFFHLFSPHYSGDYILCVNPLNVYKPNPKTLLRTNWLPCSMQ